MWPEVISAIGGIAGAVLGQAVFFSPESRRVRRLRAYIEVKAKVNDEELKTTLDDLIATSIADEARVQARNKRTWVFTLRALGWIALALVFGGAGLLAASVLGGVVWPYLVAAASFSAGVYSVFNAREAAKGAADVRTELTESELEAAYAEDALSRGLKVDATLPNRRPPMFDLVLRDNSGAIVEIAEVRKIPSAQLLRQLFNLRLRARQLEPGARFVAILGEKPNDRLLSELKRHGIDVAYQGSGGNIERVV